MWPAPAARGARGRQGRSDQALSAGSARARRRCAHTHACLCAQHRCSCRPGVLLASRALTDDVASGVCVSSAVALPMGLFGLGRGEPVSVEFSLGLVSLTPWPANPPLRRLAFRWQRGTKVRCAPACCRPTHTRMAVSLLICEAPHALTLSRASLPQRFGVSRAVHPRLEDAAPRGAPLTYEFDDTLVVPATLYKARTKAVTERTWRRYSGAFEQGPATARVHCCAPVAFTHRLTSSASAPPSTWLRSRRPAAGVACAAGSAARSWC